MVIMRDRKATGSLEALIQGQRKEILHQSNLQLEVKEDYFCLKPIVISLVNHLSVKLFSILKRKNRSLEKLKTYLRSPSLQITAEKFKSYAV